MLCVGRKGVSEKRGLWRMKRTCVIWGPLRSDALHQPAQPSPSITSFSTCCSLLSYPVVLSFHVHNPCIYFLKFLFLSAPHAKLRTAVFVLVVVNVDPYHVSISSCQRLNIHPSRSSPFRIWLKTFDTDRNTCSESFKRSHR